MEFQDKVIKCIDCGEDFVFTAGEQLFFHDKQFKNEPKRCKGCKAKRGQALGVTQATRRRRWRLALCVQAAVRKPRSRLRPTQGRPVFCRECFQQKKRLAPLLRPVSRTIYPAKIVSSGIHLF